MDPKLALSGSGRSDVVGQAAKWVYQIPLVSQNSVIFTRRYREIDLKRTQELLEASKLSTSSHTRNCSRTSVFLPPELGNCYKELGQFISDWGIRLTCSTCVGDWKVGSREVSLVPSASHPDHNIAGLH